MTDLDGLNYLATIQYDLTGCSQAASRLHAAICRRIEKSEEEDDNYNAEQDRSALTVIRCRIAALQAQLNNHIADNMLDISPAAERISTQVASLGLVIDLYIAEYFGKKK